jgi:hypothetical protein
MFPFCAENSSASSRTIIGSSGVSTAI